MTVIYLICINLLGLLAMALDKRFAVRFKRRIPEKHLILIACIGGAVGVLLGIKFFRHKTRHAKFYLGVPFIIVFQLLAYIFFLLKTWQQ